MQPGAQFRPYNPVVTSVFWTLLALMLSYLLGALPAGAYVARQRGVDIRTVGSGNSGATNVLRTLGPRAGLLVALFDILKGALAVWVARGLGLSDPVAGLCGLAAVLGHNFSVFTGFRGGKGVATSFGVMAVIDPPAALVVFVIGIAVMWLTRYVSAGSIVGSLVMLCVAAVLQRPAWELVVVTVLTGLIVWTHRENIVRLQAGTESRLGQKAARS